MTLNKEPDIYIRRAKVNDETGIASLYHEVYKGTYPDPLMTNLSLLRQNLLEANDYFIIATCQNEIIAAMLYKIDKFHKLAKASGAVVRPDFRGRDLTKQLMHYGLETLQDEGNPIAVIYATTRTVNKAPQRLTSQLGFAKMGIFPNVHKTDTYETHCLTCFFGENTLKKRYTNFKLHPKLKELFSIVRKEINIPNLEIASEEEIIKRCECKNSLELPTLEVIDAPEFVNHRFESLKNDGLLPVSFFPFSKPNTLITSPDQEVEVFLAIEKSDQHCVIVGIKKPRDIFHSLVYDAVSQILRVRGIRYIETLVRADKLLTINETLIAKFIPCAYFPAFQEFRDHRLDFVILSRTFEMLDLQNIQLEDTNQLYLKQYYNSWKKLCLSPVLLGEDSYD